MAAVIAEYKPKEPAPLAPSSVGDLVSDNGEISATFSKTDAGNVVTFEANGYKITYRPGELKYIDLESGLEDVICDVDTATDAFVTGPQQTLYSRHFEGVDENWRVEAGQLKHNITVAYLRSPADWMQNPLFAAGGTLEFDTRLRVRIENDLVVTGSFQTSSVIELIDEFDHTVFQLPAIVAWDQERSETDGMYIASALNPGQLDFSSCVGYAWLVQNDRSYPVVIDPTVIASGAAAYGFTGSGRKVVRLANGWICTAAVGGTAPTYAYVYISRDQGATWTRLTYANATATSSKDVAIASFGNVVYLLFNDNGGSSTQAPRLWFGAIDATNWTDGTVATVASVSSGALNTGSQLGVYITVDDKGVIHFAWSCVNGSGGYTVIHGKSTDGGTNWTLASMQALSSGNICKNPVVVLDRNRNPVVFWVITNTNSQPYYVQCRYFSATTGTWSTVINVWQPPANGTTYYTPYAVSALIDGNGRYHLAIFSGAYGFSGNHIFYISSTDLSSWTPYVCLSKQYIALPNNTTDGSANGTMVTIALDQNTNNLHVLFNYSNTNITPYPQIWRVSCINGTWQNGVAVTAFTSNPGTQSSAHALWSPYNLNSNDAIRYVFNNGTTDIEYDSFAINQAPLAPTLVQHVNFDATTQQTLAWIFNDTGDTQSAFELEIYDLTNTSQAVLTVPKTGSLQSQYTLAANVLQNGHSYQWHVKTYDSYGAVSVWSNYSTFKCSAAPQVTITAPFANAQITSDSYTFIGQYVQAAGAPQQSGRFKLYDANSNLLQDSSDMIGNTNMKTFSGLTNNTAFKIEFIAVSQDGVSASSGKIPFTVAYSPPPTPIAVVTNDPTNARVLLTWTNPTPGTGQVAASTNNVYRRKQGDTSWQLIATNATSPYLDYWCPAGAYEYAVIGVAVSGAISAYSDPAQVLHTFGGHWITDEANLANRVAFQFNSPGADWKVDQEVTVVKTKSPYGRLRREQSRSHVGTLKALFTQSSGDVSKLLAILDQMTQADSGKTYVLKLASGQMYRVSLYAPDGAFKYGAAVADVSVNWLEVAPL